MDLTGKVTLQGGSAPTDLGAGPVGAARRDAGTARSSLSNLAHDFDGFGVVEFGVHLSRRR